MLPPIHLIMGNFLLYVWSDKKSCTEDDDMIWMHVDAYFCIYMFYESLCIYVYDIGMHDYMMMHDVVCFLYAMIDVPLYNIISHLVCYMNEWNEFEMSNQVSSA